MASLVIAEHNNSAVDEATAKTVTAAAAVSKPVHVLVAGENCRAAAEKARLISGVEKVLLADDARYAGFIAEAVAALLSWAQGTFAASLEIQTDKAVVTREVDGGLQTVEVKLPAIVTTDLRLNEPRYASLPNIMKARKKPIAEKSISDFGVDPTPRLKVLEVTSPEKRRSGMRVASVNELVGKLRERGVI